MQKVLFSLIVGVLIGLIIAACASFYINNAPLPFVDRFSDREQVHVPNNWNPNASLQQGSTTVTEPPPSLRSNNNTTGNVTPDRDPAAAALTGGNNIGLPPATTPAEQTNNTNTAQFYVQAGAFKARQEAEQQRARLAMAGTQATISEVTVAGQTMHRVRVGPYNTRADAENTVRKLASNGIESGIAGS